MAKTTNKPEEGQGPEPEVKKDGEDQKEIVVPKDALIDVPVTVVSLAGDPYHADGEVFQLAKKTADQLVARGWVEIKKQE